MPNYLETALTIDDLVDGNSDCIEEYLNIYQTLFPQYGRYIPLMRKRAEKKQDGEVNESWHQWLLSVNGIPAGIVGFLYNKMRNLGLLMDFAILKEFRPIATPGQTRFSHYILTLVMQQLILDAKSNGKNTPLCLAAEVEYPSLVRKYKEYGYVQFPVEYFEPPSTPELIEIYDETKILDKLEYERMFIGAFPIPGIQVSLNDPMIIKTVLLAFLEDHYRLPSEHWMIQKLIQEIPV
ncbi:MAG TPA: hypothetical protein PK078_01095 [Anaerolineales bacterium]|nr:hypothetical protein [Anaerolineales bacterium]